MDPALDELGEAYRGGDLVLFVGAGVSAAAGLPSWSRLVEALTERARGAPAATLEEIADLARRQQFIDALSALKDCLGPADFGRAVERQLNDEKIEALPDVALAIAGLRAKLRAVLTTNIDHLLERAFMGAWPAQARATADIAQRRRFILKLHGTLLDRSTWVLTRDEYDRAMHADAPLKQAFGALFNACTLLFVGYGLADDDFDAVLARVRAFAGQQPPRHFALVPAEKVAPFRRRRLEDAGVRLIPYENSDGKHGEVVRMLRELGGGAVMPAAVPPARAAAPPLAAAPPPAAAATLLPRALVLELHAAAIQLGLGGQRGVLLSGLNRSEAARMPTAPDPASQLFSDLHWLNGIRSLTDGSVPLQIWLENALQLTGIRVESGVFQRALAALGGG